jgi:hypothetical protein
MPEKEIGVEEQRHVITMHGDSREILLEARNVQRVPSPGGVGRGKWRVVTAGYRSSHGYSYRFRIK